jgi:hypothetical protein
MKNKYMFPIERVEDVALICWKNLEINGNGQENLHDFMGNGLVLLQRTKVQCGIHLESESSCYSCRCDQCHWTILLIATI